MVSAILVQLEPRLLTRHNQERPHPPDLSQGFSPGGGDVDTCNGHVCASVYLLGVLYEFWASSRTRNIRFGCLQYLAVLFYCVVNLTVAVEVHNCQIFWKGWRGENYQSPTSLCMKPCISLVLAWASPAASNRRDSDQRNTS